MRFELYIEPVGASVTGWLVRPGESRRPFAGRIELLAALDAAFEAAAPVPDGDRSPHPIEDGGKQR